MRRGPKPAKSKEAKPPVSRKPPKDDAANVRDLKQRLEEALKGKAEALKLQAEAQDQQTATSEILKVISRSPSDLQPAFDMIADSAARLCDGIDVTIFRVDSDVLRVVAHQGPIPAFYIGQARPIVRGSPSSRAVLDRRTIHVTDLQAEMDRSEEHTSELQSLR